MKKSKYCLIGKTLKHSFSDELHKCLPSYELVELKTEEELRTFLLKKEYDGFNVTIPYKQRIIPYLDELSPEAEICGAVNTVVKTNGKYKGYNTDVFGLGWTFESLNATPKGKSVMILGGGGFARAAEFLCNNYSAAEIVKVERSGLVNFTNCYELSPQIIINATPVGTYPDNLSRPVDLSRFKSLETVIDATYNPLRTELLRQAEELNVKCVNGLMILAAQAAKTDELFLEKRLKINAVNTVRDIIKKKKNIILIGLSGAGKTAIGRKLARKLKRPFYDTDEIIERETEMSITEIFSKKGEEFFRKCEKTAINSLNGVFGAVISTGGGAVIDKENAILLRQNGFIIEVKRDAEKIDVKNRPLYTRTTPEKLFEERKHIYESVSDCVIENNGKISEGVKKIIKLYENSCH